MYWQEIYFANFCLPSSLNFLFSNPLQTQKVMSVVNGESEINLRVAGFLFRPNIKFAIDRELDTSVK